MNRMLKKSAVFSLFLCFINCNSDDTPFITREQEQSELNEKYKEIISLADKECIEAGDWSFTALGSDSCGFPKEYIAYPLTINTTQFLQKVSEYTNAEQRFNTKWGLNSECSSPPSLPVPTGVACADGKPELTYE